VHDILVELWGARIVLKNSVVTRQRGAEQRGFKTISTVYRRILEYSNGTIIHIRSM
jgi:hypothetical protein